MQTHRKVKGMTHGIFHTEKDKPFSHRSSEADPDACDSMETDPENATMIENCHAVHADKHSDEVFSSRLVHSIREATANIEKISSFECEDMENQDPEDVF
jgi:hypothetical protein